MANAHTRLGKSNPDKWAIAIGLIRATQEGFDFDAAKPECNEVYKFIQPVIEQYSKTNVRECLKRLIKELHADLLQVRANCKCDVSLQAAYQPYWL